MSEPIENTAYLPVFDDATDDYLSISSKKSYEEGPMDFVVEESTNNEKEKLLDVVINNTSQNIINQPTDNERQESIDSVAMETLQDAIDKLVDDKNDRPLFNSTDGSVDKDNELDLLMGYYEEQSGISTGSNSDKQMVMISSDLEIIDQSQQSKLPMTDQQVEDQSIIGTFYIPDDDETESDGRHSNTSQRYVQNENDQVLNISDTSSDPEPQSKIETVSERSADTPLGEPYIYTSLGYIWSLN
jgi:hypothetical protein